MREQHGQVLAAMPLGLQRARKHGGRAFAESAGQGRGSTFTLLLPGAPV
jgi:signal transduction histidine kinase